MNLIVSELIEDPMLCIYLDLFHQFITPVHLISIYLLANCVNNVITRLATVRSGPDCGLFWRLLKRLDCTVQSFVGLDCTVQSFVGLDWTVPKDRTVRR